MLGRAAEARESKKWRSSEAKALLMEHPHCWGEAVGGAGGAGHALHGGVVGVLSGHEL